MNYFYRIFINLIATVILFCFVLILPAYSLPFSIIPVTADDFFKLGVENMQSGKYQSAINYFQKTVESKKDFTAAYSNRCLAYINIQDYQSAIADCTQAINLSPKRAQAYINRGLAYYRLGDYQAAIADQNRAIALKPSDYRAYYNRGIANASVGKYQQAITDYNLSLSQIPQISTSLLANIYNDRGLAHLELANMQAAMLDFNQAIRFNHSDHRAFFNRGCACVKNKNYLDAMRNFTEAIRLNPSDGHAYINRAIASHYLGYEQHAIADLLKAADFFEHQGEKLAYQKTLDLLDRVQKQIPSATAIA